MTHSAFKALQTENPWPDITGLTAWDYTLGGGGRELVDALIKSDKPKFMLEIGCFLCASAKRWLNLDPDLKLVGVDPWDEEGLTEQVKRYVGRPNLTRKYPDRETQLQFVHDVETQTPFCTALANLRGLEDRFIPYRGLSPNALYELKEKGFEPDLVYIDAGKNMTDLEVSHTLWPSARITGDDWHWNRAHGYPMRKIVYGFAEKHGYSVEAEWATWVLQPLK
ncbi:hypothetical protein [Kordiimonas pumila]|uniref:Methyltransferase n=1 Tax=Kordiimonas pumila TaxID=2161677 RepID=A0ABV7D796_9PROT|nr:hypothetical protein [Kordiimonas pumila]